MTIAAGEILESTRPRRGLRFNSVGNLQCSPARHPPGPLTLLEFELPHNLTRARFIDQDPLPRNLHQLTRLVVDCCVAYSPSILRRFGAAQVRSRTSPMRALPEGLVHGSRGAEKPLHAPIARRKCRRTGARSETLLIIAADAIRAWGA